MFEKILVKDYKNTSDPVVRNRYATVAGVIGIVSNLLLGVAKILIGYLSNSISIMADAANNISDCASCTLTIAGARLSARDPDSKHPYGYARYEYIFGFAIGILMFIMGVLFAKESFTKIFHPEEIELGLSVYITLGVAVLVKLFQMALYSDYGKKISSPALQASATETRNDIISTLGIIVAMVVLQFFGINIDGYVACGISVFVIFTSIETIKEEIEPIIGIKPTTERVKTITEKLLSYPVVLGIHDLVLHNYGIHNDFVTVHVEVDSSQNIVDIHDMIDNIEMDFKKEMGILLTIHMDPVLVGNKEYDEMKALIAESLKKFDNKLMFHDLRMVEGPTHTNFIFDVVVSPDKPYEGKEIAKYLSEHIKSEKKVFFVVETDLNYC
ncbi:MAG: cation transporter [Sphaerochaetaceae bacterium]|nr:cation transporter [Sphaerochaetaceae bacterium]